LLNLHSIKIARKITCPNHASIKENKEKKQRKKEREREKKKEIGR
jgi:hypothetical protein